MGDDNYVAMLYQNTLPLRDEQNIAAAVERNARELEALDAQWQLAVEETGESLPMFGWDALTVADNN